MKRGAPADLESQPKAKQARLHTVGLLDLDDGCLLNILRHLMPLPDLFNASAVCKRFHGLSTDGRLWLGVSQNTTHVHHAKTGRRCRQTYSTLQAAIGASRPGDTIVLHPQQQYEASNIVVPWPLQLMGGGQTAEDTSLWSHRGSDAALDFRSTGKVTNLSITATLSNCITHRRGKLTIDRCKLQCHAAGLDHLFTPLLTLAAIPRGVLPKASVEELSRAPHAGVVTVIETKIRGGLGATAVKCAGSGKLQSVRVISLQTETLFWFDVAPPTTASSAVQPATPARACFQPLGLPKVPMEAPDYQPPQMQQKCGMLVPVTSNGMHHVADGGDGNVFASVEADQAIAMTYKAKAWQAAQQSKCI